MIHPETSIVTVLHTRSAGGGRGRPDKCFYCSGKLGAEHDADCVCRKRTVVVKATIEMVMVEPESWTKDDIEFRLNESSWCAGNIVSNLEHGPRCLCGLTEFDYVREATEEDEEGWDLEGRLK